MTLSTQAAADRLLIGGAAANPVPELHSIKFGTLFFQNPLREGPPLSRCSQDFSAPRRCKQGLS